MGCPQSVFTRAGSSGLPARFVWFGERKVFYDRDGHPCITGKELHRCAGSQQDRIAADSSCPGDSPNLNPDELFEFRTSSRTRRSTSKDKCNMMRSLTRSVCASTQKQPAKVRRYFREEHVAYAGRLKCPLLSARSNSK